MGIDLRSSHFPIFVAGDIAWMNQGRSVQSDYQYSPFHYLMLVNALLKAPSLSSNSVPGDFWVDGSRSLASQCHCRKACRCLFSWGGFLGDSHRGANSDEPKEGGQVRDF